METQLAEFKRREFKAKRKDQHLYELAESSFWSQSMQVKEQGIKEEQKAQIAEYLDSGLTISDADV
jgi:hypothetical protein